MGGHPTTLGGPEELLAVLENLIGVGPCIHLRVLQQDVAVVANQVGASRGGVLIRGRGSSVVQRQFSIGVGPQFKTERFVFGPLAVLVRFIKADADDLDA